MTETNVTEHLDAAYAPMEADIDAPMPSVENAPACIFRPGRDITAADVFETALMFLLEMTNSPLQVEPGALRGIQLSGHRVAQLSDSARRFMAPVGTV